MFFNYYLKKIVLNNVPGDFNKTDLSYLLKPQYNGAFLRHVYNLPDIAIDEFLRLDTKGGEYRITYNSMDAYTSMARRLKLMADTKVS